ARRAPRTRPQESRAAAARAWSYRIAAQRLGHAVHATPAEREHAHVGVVDLEPGGTQRLVECLRRRRRYDLAVTERHHVAPESHGVAIVYGHELDLLRLQPVENPIVCRIEADGGELRSEHADHEIDMDVVLGDLRQLHLPALLLQPDLYLNGRRLLRAL